MPENRLEKKRESVSEQKARLAELEKKKKSTIKVLKPEVKEAKPSGMTVAFATILTTMLCCSTTGMFSSTYYINVNVLALGALVCAFAALCAWAHVFGESLSKIGIIVASVFVVILLLGLNIGGTRTQAQYFYSTAQRTILQFLPAYFPNAGKKIRTMTIWLFICNLIPAYVTTWVIAKRKNIFLAILCYVPFLVLALEIRSTKIHPLACEVFVAGLLLIMVFQHVRKLGDDTADIRMLKLLIPVIVFVAIIGLCFPKSRYDKSVFATKKMQQVQSIMKKFTDNDIFKKDKDQTGNDESDKGYKGSVTVDKASGEMTVNVSSEDLSKVGYFDPPDIKVMEVSRYVVPSDDQEIKNSRYLYLRTASFEGYSGNTWYSLTEERDPSYYGSLELVDPENGSIKILYDDPAVLGEKAFTDYVVEVKPLFSSPYRFIPYYTDNYLIPSGSTYEDKISKGGYPQLSESVQNKDGSMDYFYAYNYIPLQLEHDWNPEYLEKEIYEDCLYVPEETRKALLESGILEDWFIDVMEGRETMPVAEKVERVIEFVRSIHPYNAMTPYPPEDVDFVTWFLNDSSSGFCVHYATSAAILLRMLDVPTRYVSGYMIVHMNNDHAADVSMRDAHAWFEYFDEVYGWIMEDPTPGNGYAGSYFSTWAIAGEYKDERLTGGYTPAPTPGASTNITPNIPSGPSSSTTDPGNSTPSSSKPSREETMKEKPKINWGKVICEALTHPLLITFYILIGIILLCRAIFVLYWKTRFRRGSTMDRAKAYSSYFDMHIGILKGHASHQVRAILNKSEYSKNGIGEEEITRLIRFGKHNLTVQRRNRKFFRKFLSEKVMDVKIR